MDDLGWQRLGEVLGFPSRGDGRGLLGVGAVFFGLAFWFFLRLRVPAPNFSVPLAAVFALLPAGYLVSHLLQGIQSGASGRTTPPGWPDWHGAYDSAVRPLLTSLVLLGMSFGPALVALGIVLSHELWIALPVVALLALAGILVAPMAFLTYTYFQSLAVAASPAFVFEQIGKVLPEYSRCVATLVPLGAAQAGATALAYLGLWRVPLAGEPLVFVAGAFVALYGGMVACHLLGQLYAREAETLGWAERRPRGPVTYQGLPRETASPEGRSDFAEEAPVTRQTDSPV